MSLELERVRSNIDDVKIEIARYDAQIKHAAGNTVVRDQHQRVRDKASARLSDLEERELKLLDEQRTPERLHELQQVAFWQQRMNTSVALAHGAAFAAIAAHIFDPTTTAQSAGLGLPAFAIFGLGLVLAGAIPLLITAGHVKRSTELAWGSSLLFVAGVMAAIIGAAFKSLEWVWYWQPH